MSPPDESARSHPNHHDVFISYAQLDKPIADAVCAKLESHHLRCWIAPRDVLPGKNFPEAIIDAIVDSRVVVLIFSSHANNSPHVIRELTMAVNKGRIIVPFRVEDVMPSKSMEYLISVPHWLDAITPPLEKHIDELAEILGRILASGKQPAACPSCKSPVSPVARFCDSCGAPVSPAPASPPPQPEASSPAEPAPPSQPPAPQPVADGVSPGLNRRIALIGAAIAIVVLLALFLLLPAMNISLIPTHGGAGGPTGAAPNNTVPNITQMDYRGSEALTNTVVLVTGQTDILPNGTELFVQADKDSLNAEVSVQFTGGPGQGLVKENRVILTRSDGTVTEGKLDFDQRLSEVTLQGTRGTDRLQVIITMYSNVTYTIVDRLMPYRVRQ